jgi:uncharacterized protein (TIGR02597 family)
MKVRQDVNADSDSYAQLGVSKMKTNIPARLIVCALLAVALLAGSMASTQAVDVTTTPVGFYQVPVNTSPQFTMVGLPMVPVASDRGVISGVTSNVLTVNCATCGTSNYGQDASLQSQYYVTFPTGAGVGRYFAIITNDATTLTLAVENESLAALGSGGSVQSNDTYTIRRFWHLADIFGPASNCVLTASTRSGSADAVYIYNHPSWIPAYPNSSGAGSWYVNNQPNNTYPILPDEGLFVLRKTGSATNALLIGEVPVTNNMTVLQGGEFNAVCMSFPAGTTLDNSGLTNAGSGFHGATRSGSADILYVYVSPSWVPCYYNTSGAGSWYVNNQPTNGYPIGATQGLLILNKTTGGYWSKPLPYTP